mgnify:CR=1 FL=1
MKYNLWTIFLFNFQKESRSNNCKYQQEMYNNVFMDMDFNSIDFN